MVNFTCVCTGGRGRPSVERSFSHSESFSAVIFLVSFHSCFHLTLKAGT